ncbi:DnaA initiator-associating protein DiaA [Citrobacter koseri]|uniref:DnaA initiator-associating protein DiaA n=1 Tax=Citrobacter koseri TaxID=545 RepID=A0A2X2W818_CITKO|nr:DnaA initiator-associating protein DiaA [Citrobacter koseri]
MLDRIKVCFTESIQTQIAAAEALPDAISRAAMTLVHSLLNGNKILCCGNGTSAANAQHFAASMNQPVLKQNVPVYPLLHLIPIMWS